MTKNQIDTGQPSAPDPQPRKSDRIAVNAEVILRRPGQQSYRVRVFDTSRHGCKIEFIERPKLDERAWVKFDGMEALDALVCWVDGHIAGVEFEKEIHPAVFDVLLGKLT